MEEAEKKVVEKKKPNIFKRALLSYRKIPDKKPYIEFITALLSVPVLLTVILLNLNTLTGSKDKETTPTPAPEKIFVTLPGGVTNAPTLSDEECTKAIGPININPPEENETVSDNPVVVAINYQQGNFCSAVWSYRINGGRWSDYDDKSIALYNPPAGNIKFELRVKSVVTSDTENLVRNFVYKTDSLSITPTASASAN